MPEFAPRPEQFTPPVQEQQPQPPQQTVEADLPVVPKQYEGLSSDVVEELWDKPAFIDPEKNQQEVERREKALEELRKQEVAKITGETQFIREAVDRLPENKKVDYEQGINNAPAILSEYFQGSRDLPVRLTPEEQQLLDKMSALYKDAKTKNPEQPVAFQFSKPTDSEVYSNLLGRIGLEVVSAKGKVKDKEEVNRLRGELGLPPEPYETPPMSVGPQEDDPSFLVSEAQETKGISPETRESNEVKGNEVALNRLATEFYAERVQKSKNPNLAKTVEQIVDKLRQEDSTKEISYRLAEEIRKKIRDADYPQEAGYIDAWDLATQDQGLPAKKENDWVYRGNFPSKEKGQVTETRGSLNIKMSPEAVRDLDDLIKKGVIKGNYKFGDPNSGARGTDRHDAVTVYFLEKPDQNALDALSEVAKKHYRGNDLVGQKIAEGFYLSEIGSVPDKEAENLLNQLSLVDPELSKGMRNFLTNIKGRVAMSEAQFYAAKEALDAYGLDLQYDATKGIAINPKN